MSRSELVELTLRKLHATDRAVLVTDSDTESAVWLPLAQIEVGSTGRGSLVTVTLPEWLAEERGLI